MDENDKKLKEFLLQYSLNDLARSFFVLNLWLPNIASPIKSQYLYVVLESIYNDLPTKKRINNYEDFKSFCGEILRLLPSFAMLEDYIPEADWGEIKYFFQDKFYKIFYGADLSNPYDFYYSFEIIHKNFNDYYTKNIKRSVLKEFKFCLDLQNYLIENIDLTKHEKPKVSPGDISIPSKDFWEKLNNFLDRFKPDDLFDFGLVSRYTRDFNTTQPSSYPEMSDFMSKAYDGKNCLYFFIKKDDKYYPILPRKYFSVLYDAWGNILKQNYSKIIDERKTPQIDIGIELFKFIRNRVDESEVFGLVSPLHQDQKPHDTIFAAAVRSKNKLFLIHITPPLIDSESLYNYLNNLNSQLKECGELLSTFPTRLLLRAQKKIVEFRSKKEGEKLTPFFLTVIPYCSIDFVNLTIPKDLPGEVMGLEQVAGIFDEIKHLNELSDFFDYIENLQSSCFIPPITSYLDKFGSFRDSHGVIIPGAREPNMMILDLNWGSNFRYRSLSEFWQRFPEVVFFGHPRSWEISEEDKIDKGVILKSKSFFGYAYHYKVSNSSFFINSPAHLMSFNQGKISDLMMETLFDSLKVYEDVLCELSFINRENKIQVLFTPASLIKKKEDLSHLNHLIPQEGLWLMDITRIRMKDYGIRVVFDEQKIISVLQNAKDRSIQIKLLIDVLKQINSKLVDDNFSKIEQKLNQEKSKKCRFKTFYIAKKVSFPELVRTILPEEKDFKMADKMIAQIASEINVEPGKYNLEEAKIKINQLIQKLTERININVNSFNLDQALPLLLEKIDALSNEYDIKKVKVKESLDQEVDYERESRSGEEHIKFIHHHKNYRYLIEKFVQLQPCGDQELTIPDLKHILALVDRLLTLYSASDILHYDIYPTEISIDSDYLVSVSYSVNIKDMGDKYSKEQAGIDLGVIGDKKDVPEPQLEIEDYLEELDQSFKTDFDFSFKDFINLQQILSLWAVYNKNVSENSNYNATIEEITQVCSANIKNFDASKTDKMLEFLTLKPEEILKIIGESSPTNNLPVWEHQKRVMRYTIKPLIKIKNKYHWGPYSAYKSSIVWGNIPHANKLPADIDGLTISNTLKKGHESTEIALANKVKEIVGRFTKHIESGVYPHKIDDELKEDIGDYDVLAFLKDKNILLNVESKIIDPVYCLKDIKRVREKIFGREKEDGSFEEGYLQRVERRSNYLEENYLNVARKFNWPLSDKEPPRIISIFVTQISFWWTKFTPVKTEVNFVEIKLLNYFIKKLVDK